MLFNSYTFLFAFLPIVLAGAFALSRYRPNLAVAWLALASLFFYGWWSWRHVPLLLASIAFNFFAGDAIARRGGKNGALAFGLLAGAVAVNLALLGYFKYAGFLVANLDTLLGADVRVEAMVLPLGISFFTFTQVAYLVDVYRDPARYGALPYGLFVSYFPHLIAGPILHHREMMPQFTAPSSFRFQWANLAAGLTIFAIGLFKKTVLADGIAPYASPVYAQAAQGYAPGMVEAWGAAFSFGLQLYFDFSGYSDMAVGLSKMLGVRMPVNFESPYKATSMIVFWRRWHMTLSRFLRDYVYIVLGGNRRGPSRAMLNVMITMLLGGLWHGAGWTFVAWGGLHGLYLAVERVLRAKFAGYRPGPLMFVALGLLTYTLINLTWVFFRAKTFGKAWDVLRGMLGLNVTAKPILTTYFIVSVGFIVGSIVLVHWLMRGRTLESVVSRAPAFAISAVWALMAFAIVIAQGSGNAFIYFQF